MSDKKKDEDAPASRKHNETAKQTGVTLRLGPDSKLSLPIQGGNLVMMLVIAGQLFFKFANLPDDVRQIGEDIDQIQLDVESLKTQGTERDKSIGSNETKIEMLTKEVDELKVEVSNLKSDSTKAETRVSELEKENERLVICARRPSKCRL